MAKGVRSIGRNWELCSPACSRACWPGLGCSRVLSQPLCLTDRPGAVCTHESSQGLWLDVGALTFLLVRKPLQVHALMHNCKAKKCIDFVNINSRRFSGWKTSNKACIGLPLPLRKMVKQVSIINIYWTQMHQLTWGQENIRRAKRIQLDRQFSSFMFMAMTWIIVAYGCGETQLIIVPFFKPIL